MKSADDRMDAEAVHVQRVISADLGATLYAANLTAEQSEPTNAAIPISAALGSTTIENESANMSPTSKHFDKRSRRWRLPLSVREFAAQANAVATMVLNGEVETDLARTYSSIARTVAQAMTTEVQRARFLGTIPELSFDAAIWEDEDEEG